DRDEGSHSVEPFSDAAFALISGACQIEQPNAVELPPTQPFATAPAHDATTPPPHEASTPPPHRSAGISGQESGIRKQRDPTTFPIAALSTEHSTKDPGF